MATTIKAMHQSIYFGDFMGIVRLAPLIAIWIGLAGPERAAQDRSIPLHRAKIRFELAEHLSLADDGKLWGQNLHGPMLFADPQTKFAVANQADQEGLLKAIDGVWIGTLPDHIQVANTSIEWGGVRWTMVNWQALQNSAYEAGRLLMHESFHRIQPSLGFHAASPANSHLEQEEARAWMRLEMRALAIAMVQQGDQRRSAAKDAMLFRLIRRSLIGATASDEEDALEANEGLAEYTGLKLSGMPMAAQEQRTAVALEQRESSRTFTRSFAYATGPAMALLLDELDPDWRESAAANPKLADRLIAALHFQSPTENSLLASGMDIARRLYDGQQVFDEENHLARNRAIRLRELNEMFHPEHILKIETSANFRFSFDPNAAEPLDEKRVFHRPLNASDDWGSVEAPGGALVDFTYPMGLALPIPTGATPETVPWKLKLNPGFSLQVDPAGPWKIVRAPKEEK